MKKFFVLLMTVFFCLSAFSQESTPVTKTMTWNGTQRQYLEYVPASYDPSTPTPVIICFHGVGKTMNYFFETSRFYRIADAHGWILITPQALDYRIPVIYYNMGSTWDAGVSVTVGFTGLTHVVLNEGVDDAGWVLSIIDNLSTLYNIDQNNVFCTGVSMGGFMSNRMAIEHSDRIKAVASVNGTIGNELTSSTPIQHISTMHIHGTADDTITYAEAGFPLLGSHISLGLGAEATVDYWRNFNQCSPTAIHTAYPDIMADGKTFEQFLYTDGISHTKTAFIKTTNGHHEWYYTPNNDIDYATEIYNFFVSCMETVPTVTTNSISDILSSSATGGGNVTSDGNADITARGICWSTSHNPTLDSPHTTDSLGLGSFTSILTGLTPNTTYYVRAYATNSEGTAYGDEVSFITPCEAMNVTISGDTLFCAGDTAVLTASGAVTYLWSTTDNTAEITVTVSGTYTVTGTDVNGCVNTASHTVTVNELPEITISGDTLFCNGGSTILTASGADTYEWSTMEYGAENEVSVAGTYTVIGTDTNGCVNTASQEVSTVVIDYAVWDTDGYWSIVFADPEAEYQWVYCENYEPVVGETEYGFNPPEFDTYYACIITLNGCSDTTECFFAMDEAVDEWSNRNLTLYPNPTTGIVTINMSPENCALNPEIQVFDMYGKLVETFHKMSLQQTGRIDLSRYSPGVYIIKAVSNGKPVAIGKVVKK